MEQGPAMRMAGVPGAGSRGTAGPFFFAKNTAADSRKPGFPGFERVPTSGGAGTGGIQSVPPNVSMELLTGHLRQKTTQ